MAASLELCTSMTLIEKLSEQVRLCGAHTGRKRPTPHTQDKPRLQSVTAFPKTHELQHHTN